MATPLQIEIGIHYCCSRESDYRNGDLVAPAVKQAIETFVFAGLLANGEGKQRYSATDGMRAWVDALTLVPFPKQQWVVPVERGDDAAV